MLWLHACMLLQHNVQVLEGIYVFTGLQTFLMARYNYMYFSINFFDMKYEQTAPQNYSYSCI